MYEVIAFLAGAIIGFVVGFFVGGKHKERLMRAAGIITGTAEEVAATIKDAGKKL